MVLHSFDRYFNSLSLYDKRSDLVMAGQATDHFL